MIVKAYSKLSFFLFETHNAIICLIQQTLYQFDQYKFYEDNHSNIKQKSILSRHLLLITIVTFFLRMKEHKFLFLTFFNIFSILRKCNLKESKHKKSQSQHIQQLLICHIIEKDQSHRLLVDFNLCYQWFQIKSGFVILRYKEAKMCQCLVCDCIWCNVCGVFCAGVAQNLLCCRCWMCKDDQLKKIEPECCNFGWSGYGGNFCCYGVICCAPDAVRNWSKAKSAK